MKGININCDRFPFVEMILNGDKTIETRNSPTLSGLIGQRVGLIQTGKGKRAMLMGYATIDGVMKWRNRSDFKLWYWFHRIPANDPDYGFKYGYKYGYRLSHVERLSNPRPVYSQGIVIRDI